VQEGQTITAGDRIGMIRSAPGSTSICRRGAGRWSPRARPRSPARPCWPIWLWPTPDAPTGLVNRRAGQCCGRRGDTAGKPLYWSDHVHTLRTRPNGSPASAVPPIPVRTLLPNMITLLALCAGLTAIRLAFEQKLEWALAAIVFAAALDGIDGRVARMIKGQSRFGAELDSLADFVNFGCAPGLILYLWGLHDLGNVGWIVAMVFAICGALRLARFNVMIDDPNRPLWAGNFFTGIPAPAGALVVMLPIYVDLLGGPKTGATPALLYTLAIAFLMVSKLPVFSGKRVGKAGRSGLGAGRCSCWWCCFLRC